MNERIPLRFFVVTFLWSWAIWHIPLFFVPGSSQIYMPFIAFTLGLIGECFFFSWILKASGGRPLSAVIAHGTVNAFVPLFPTIVMEPDVVQVRWWIHQTLVLVAGVLFMLRFTWCGRGRKPDWQPEEISS